MRFEEDKQPPANLLGFVKRIHINIFYLKKHDRNLS